MIKYVPAKHFSPGAPGRKVTLVTIHTAECPESAAAAENLQAWTAGANASKASWHYAIDPDSTTQSVLEKDVAWHAGPVNGFSIGIEHAGYAAQTAAQWDDDASRAILERSAALVADLCVRYAIPPVRLTAADLAKGYRTGICGHVDVTNGLTGGKGHQDPGPFFPWDAYLARVRELAYATGEIERTELVRTPEKVRAALQGFVEVEHDSQIWEVCPVYVAPVGIGEAERLAEELGCELPSPGLVDAIWREADLRIDGTDMISTSHDGTPRTMDSLQLHDAQTKKLASLVGGRSLGRDFFLLAGAYKDVVRDPKSGKIGLYGWHRENGTPIQPFFAGHARGWKDYSQALRLVRRKA